jgi:hypothetical protein
MNVFLKINILVLDLNDSFFFFFHPMGWFLIPCLRSHVNNNIFSYYMRLD